MLMSVPGSTTRVGVVVINIVYQCKLPGNVIITIMLLLCCSTISNVLPSTTRHHVTMA